MMFCKLPGEILGKNDKLLHEPLLQGARLACTTTSRFHSTITLSLKTA
jgi:hypothetical protein